MVEGIPRDSPESSSADDDGDVSLGIRQVFRYGIQMVTHIGNTGTRDLRFLTPQIQKDGDARYLLVDAENIGERWLRSACTAELYDTKGNYVQEFDGGMLRMYPGTSVRFRVDLSTVEEGTYRALVILDCGDDDVFGASYTLKVQRDD